MRVAYSKEFVKAVQRLSGKQLQSVIATLDAVKAAPSVEQVQNCKKIESLNSVYRIRIGNRRAFFVLHISIEGDLASFEYLVNRGEAYDKKNMDRLRLRDV
jgi:mRNA-degrading endonuclease RelE of RelBE toxin-antitoxin system